MDLKIVEVKKPPGLNVILGHSHFIKTVEDLYEILVTSVPGIKFGLAFSEASSDRLIRKDGTDEELIELAVKNAEDIGAGHSFIIFLRDSFPINVLNQIKNCQEVCNIFCATANPVQVIIVETEKGRGILGVVDGKIPLGVEQGVDREHRKEFLRELGYKQ